MRCCTYCSAPLVRRPEEHHRDFHRRRFCGKSCVNKKRVPKAMVGQTFGRLQVVSDSGERAGDGQIRWSCKCVCGQVVSATGGELRRGNVRSCGCLATELASARQRIHGHSVERSPEYRAWCGMTERCYSKRNRAYPNWGGRGIRVCDRWRNSFEAFLADMGPRPGPEYSIDRIDNDGNYEPTNCRWAKPKDQSRNRRSNRHVEIHGTTLTLAEWLEKLGLSKGGYRDRIRRGATPVEALTKPVARRVG